MPTPNPGETEKEFIPRCIKIMSDEDSGREHKQIIAICYSVYKNRKKSNEEILTKIDKILK